MGKKKKQKKWKEPRQYSLIKFDYSQLPKEYHNGYPFAKDKRYVYLGEIPNFRGHCIVSNGKDKLFTGFHTDNFVELTDDELDEFMPAF